MPANTRKSIQGLVQNVRNQSIKDLALKVRSYISAVSKIVLGVSISIWLNNLNESWGQRDIARNFLKGVKADLVNDQLEMRDDSTSIDKQFACAKFMSEVSNSTQISDDSLKRFLRKNISIFTTNTILAPNNGRYEGAKSAGQLRYLKNDSLANKIFDLYEERLPWLIMNENDYVKFREDFLTECFVKQGITLLNANIAYLRNPKLAGYYTYLRDKLSVIHDNYARCLHDTELVLKLVEEELGE
ncbi:MAG: DUF6090 family protein [Bacteroidota bacterium]